MSEVEWPKGGPALIPDLGRSARFRILENEQAG